MKIKIIAEIGVNHNGSLDLAKKMIDSAHQAGADIIKFQTYKAEEVMTDQTPLADYMEGGESENFLDLARSLELSNQDTLELKHYVEELGVEFLSSPFDVPSVYFLRDCGLKLLKIPSGEAVNPFVLKAAAETGLEIIISTGMCTMEEIAKSLEILKTHSSGPVTIMHCTTQYPAPVDQINLRAMLQLKEVFGCKIGYSDHTLGIEISLAAVALGATCIEKHFTIDRSLPGPDQEASLLPDELRALVSGIRNIEKALGDGEKKPFTEELEIAKVARKSLVVRSAMAAGSVVMEESLTAKRPGTGIPALELENVVGKRLKSAVVADEQLTWDILE